MQSEQAFYKEFEQNLQPIKHLWQEEFIVLI